jgi:hypothetical protein
MTGTGTELDPYIISSLADLQDMEDDLDVWYELANDIDASDTSTWNAGAGFLPIGSAYLTPFIGHFDGNSYTISGLFINSSNRDAVGLFGWVCGAATIQNVGLIDCDITTTRAAVGSYAIGSLIGFLYATSPGAVVSKCFATGSVTNNGTTTGVYDQWAAGLIGESAGSSEANTPTVLNCYTRCTVDGTPTGASQIYHAGFTADLDYASVTNCYSTGAVSCTPSGTPTLYQGGFATIATGPTGVTVTACFWDTETSGQATSDEGTGKTTAEMKIETTFTGTGWDFTTIWHIVAILNDGYPQFEVGDPGGYVATGDFNYMVIYENEVLLNGVRYPLREKVVKSISFSSVSELKHYLMRDQTGGIGCLELKRNADLKKCWWSTCDLDTEGHLIPQPMANGYTVGTLAVTPTGFTDPDTSWGDEANAYDNDITTYAADPVMPLEQWSSFLQLSFASMSIAGILLKVGRDNANVTKIDIDYYNGSWVNVFEDTIPAAMLTSLYHTAVSASTVTQIRVRFYNADAAFNREARLYEAKIIQAGGAITNLSWLNFNNNLYMATNSLLYKLDTGAGASFTFVKAFLFPITCLAQYGANMIVGFSGGAFFEYMNTSEAFTTTDVTGCLYAIQAHNRAYWISSTGQLYYTATLAASPAVTTDALLSDAGSTIQGLDSYQDATGEEAIYCRTNHAVWVHDWVSTPTKWLKTNVDLASHASTGKAGLVRDGYFISQGIHLIKYTTGNYNATIKNDYGLDAQDGIPSEYNAHIVNLVKGVGCFYALYDSTQVGSATYSWVGKYNELNGAWSVMWATPNATFAMHAGVLSDVYARYFWYDCGNVIWRIPIPSTLIFPKLNSASIYNATAVHILPWLEGDAATWTKLANKIISYCKDVTTTETVTIKYRTDRTNIDVGTGWTTLVTLDTTAEAGRIATALASGVGVSANAIQIRLDLARGGTTTLAPDVQSLDLQYFDRVEIKNTFTVSISVAEYYKGYSPKQMESALKTAIASGTLLALTYRDGTDAADTYYVKIQPARGDTLTGRNHTGEYDLVLVEP